MLTLRGADFGSIFCAPGARGFFGEGYPFHRMAKWLGMTWKGTGFVSKTVTLHPRPGNMPLRRDQLTPQERWIPRSIVVEPFSGHVLNAVALSGPGAEWAFSTGRWQSMSDPLMISFMSVAESPKERLDEVRRFAAICQHYLRGFRADVALQVNRACPNTGHGLETYYAETSQTLDILGEVGVPLVVNFNPTVPGPVMKETTSHPACDALWIANTVPWGDPRINWKDIFGSEKSPLAKRDLPVPGSGGLSGPACLPLTIDRILEARELGIDKPIVGGNGIQSAGDVDWVMSAGADAVAIGVVGIVRPWRMRQIIARAHEYDFSDMPPL